MTYPMKLKKFNEYQLKIFHYCKLTNVTLETSNKFEFNGEYSRMHRKITVSNDLDESEWLATVLHELGHYWDSFDYPKFYESVTVNNAYHAISKNRPLTAKQKRAVLKCEVSAWKHGHTIAQLLRIPLGKWYRKEAKKSLSTYSKLVVKAEI